MNKKRERGFTLIEVLLIIIALSLVVFVGFYVYNQSKDTDTDKATTTVSSQTAKKTTKPVSDETANWTPVTTDAKSYSFRYPTTWTKSACDSNFVLLGPTAASAGKCQTDGTAQVILSAVKSDIQAQAKLTAADYPDLQTTAVTVDGVSGTKQTGTLQAAQEAFVGPQNGSKVINYVFFKNGTTYTAVYTQTADFTDVSSDFNLIVTKTLKFLD